MTPMTLTQTATIFSKHKLNLGCGTRPIQAPGWVNCDLHEGAGVDKAFDLQDRWPFDNASVGEIYASHVVEHLKEPVNFFLEAQRVMSPGAHMMIRVPHGRSDAWGWDMTHQRPHFLQTYMLMVPGTLEATYNLQHESARWPDCFILDEARYVVDETIAKLPLWRKWVPTVAAYCWNMTVELWVYMHRLAEDERRQLLERRVTITIPTFFMTETEALAKKAACRWMHKEWVTVGEKR